MMRPVSVAVPPRPPGAVGLDPTTGTLSWTDGSVAETGYAVEKLVAGVWTGVHQVDVPLAADNPTGDVMTWVDPSYTAGDQYRVQAVNTVGDTWNYAANGNELDPAVPTFPVVTARSEWVTFGDSSGVAAPTGLVATLTTANQVDLAWTDNAFNETGYVVERSDDLGVTWTAVAPVGADATSYSDTTVGPVTIYWYRVYATDGVTNSASSNTLKLTTPGAAPAAPAEAVATVVSANQVDLAWTDNSTTEDGFVIERSVNGGPFTELDRVAADAVAYSDLSTAAATTYQYQVRAVNGVTGSSAPAVSNSVSTPEVPPVAPSGLTTTAVASSYVDLAWTDNSTNETGFLVQRSTDSGATWTDLSTQPTDATTYSDTSVVASTTYRYQVVATNAAGSAASNTVTVTVPSGTPPAAPTNPLVTNRTQTSLTLSWTDNSTDETGFLVEIATNRTFTQSVQSFTVGPNTTSYRFSPLAPRTRYYMRVASTNAAGNSTWSPTVADMARP